MNERVVSVVTYISKGVVMSEGIIREKSHAYDRRIDSSPYNMVL